MALTGIANTLHNLSYSNTSSSAIHASSGEQNDQICIWCHTPHQANEGFAGAPLWNKATISQTFTMYGATGPGVAGTTMAGTSTAASPNAVSLACLSCHDGANAINSIVNAAGSGGWTSGSSSDVAFGNTPAGTAALMTGVDNIGIDLTNDHPISIPYGTGSTTAGGLNPIGNSLPANWVTIGGVSGGTISNALFSGDVECASCHDPHSSANGEFLRIDNAESALCLTCHNK